MADVFEDRRDLDEVRERLWDLITETPWLDWLLLTKRPENIRKMVPAPWLESPPFNVWYGSTGENQEWWDKRSVELRKVPAAVRFMSMEPLLGDVNMGTAQGINWILVGGESGPGARPMHPNWARSIRDQCSAAGVAFHFKQWGEWLPGGNNVIGPTWPHGEPERKTTNTRYIESEDDYVYRVGKKAAGRVLDGRTHDGLPIAAAAHGLRELGQ